VLRQEPFHGARIGCHRVGPTRIYPTIERVRASVQGGRDGGN
jgi:hypothetical protein